MTAPTISTDPFWGKPISTYTVQDAVRDGVLVEVDRHCVASAGLACRVVMTATAHDAVVQDRGLRVRALVMYAVLRDVMAAMQRWEREEPTIEVGDRVPVRLDRASGAGLLSAVSGDADGEGVALEAVFGLEESGEPLLTLLRPGED